MISAVLSVGRLTRYFMRRVIRGHYYLHREDKAPLIQELRNEICDEVVKFRIHSRNQANHITSTTDHAYAQFFYSKILNIYFNVSLLFSLGSKTKLIYPLPKFSRIIIQKKGLKVNNFLCSVLWFLAVLFFYFLAFKNIYKYNSRFWRCSFQKGFEKSPKLVMFNVTPSCLSMSNGEDENNLMSWCFKMFNLPPDSVVFHDADIEGNRRKLISLKSKSGLFLGFYPKNIIELCKFNMGCMSVFRKSFSKTFFCSGMNSLLLAGKVDSLAFEGSSIASDTTFCFNLANYIYRPLWVEMAEKRGCRVAFCLYSTNIELFPLKPGSKLIFGWQFVSWKTIYAWDEYQKEFLRRNLPFKDVDIHVVGAIPLSDCIVDDKLLLDAKAICGVFDIQPHRFYRYASTGYPHSYYDGKAARNFLHDVDKVTSAMNLTRVIKRKRDPGRLSHTGYLSILSSLLNSGWAEYPHNSNPVNLLQKSTLVVCMPFTSVAIQAKTLNIPVVYYDPGGLIHNPEEYSHGIKTLISPNELKAWMELALKAKPC